MQLAADLAVALALILFHATVLICQFMTFSVAMNSKRSNAIIALLIASNFVEIKGVGPRVSGVCMGTGCQLSDVSCTPFPQYSCMLGPRMCDAMLLAPKLPALCCR